ncbi:MAG: DNA mismatch repair MSH5-like [Trebouxia sp. A1-2]|nr:MAG: DNA mismatch repair MSH5-like [Trebouxia sp. A1-2]
MMQGSICTELIQRLCEYRPHLNRAVAVAAEVDCLISLALAAREHHYTRPLLTKDNVLHIKQGMGDVYTCRHMLTEMVVDNYIPNDTHMNEDDSRIQVITGPNLSGKSCYTKQVALIVFLAHVGSFVPAAEATIGLTDRIFTRIASQDSVSVPQSTFMIDLSQLAMMLQLATPRCLCIVDEFGKGTLTTDGVGLLTASLHHFASMPVPPKLLACTHFSDLLSQPILRRCPQLSFFTMNVLAETPPDSDSAYTKKVVFLYNLVSGYAAPSFGLNCAHMAGMRADIIERAAQVIGLQQQGKPIQQISAPSHAQREAWYRSMISDLLSLDCKSSEAVHRYMDGGNVEE